MSGQRFRVVLIEDCNDDVRLLREALDHAMDCDYVVLNDGEEALNFVDRMDQMKPDLIILDLNLPKADGIEVLAKYRARPDAPNVPVIVFTTSPSPADRKRVTALGVNDFALKPMNLDEYMTIGRRFKKVLDDHKQ